MSPDDPSNMTHAALVAEVEALRAEVKALRSPDLRIVYGFEAGLEEGRAERDALTARIEAALAIIGPHPAYSTLWDVQRALSPQEGT